MDLLLTACEQDRPFPNRSGGCRPSGVQRDECVAKVRVGHDSPATRPKYAFSFSSWSSRVSQAFDYFPHSLDNSRWPIKVDLLDCVPGGVVVRILERYGVGHHHSGISRWCRGGHLITSDFPQHLDRTIQHSLVNAPSPRSEPPCRPACGH